MTYFSVPPCSRYGVVGCGQRVARADPVRTDFAYMNGVKAFQQEHDAVLESLEGNCCESYLVVLGGCHSCQIG